MLLGAPKLTDFPPMQQEEFHKMIVVPTASALQQGIPITAPVEGLPLQVLCQLIRTVQLLAHQSESAFNLFGETFSALSVDTHLELKQKLAPYALTELQLKEFYEKYPLPFNPIEAAPLTPEEESAVEALNRVEKKNG